MAWGVGIVSVFFASLHEPSPRDEHRKENLRRSLAQQELAELRARVGGHAQRGDRAEHHPRAAATHADRAAEQAVRAAEERSQIESRGAHVRILKLGGE